MKKPKIAEGAEAKKIQEAPVADEKAAVDAMKNAKMIPHHVAEYLPLVGSAIYLSTVELLFFGTCQFCK